MPLVKKKVSVAAGATSDQILAGTTYEYVDPGTRIVVAAAVDTAGTATADTTGTLEESDGSTQIGQFYLENGDTVIIEKHPAEKITCPTSKASAVGSPRG